ncbi:protein dj-1beta-like [Neodiprion virginianus]|uniref:Protein dj-1beta n=1 Tax=Neodiprion lecontei TaxID=441921 RepID=A0A6J0BFA0_NEOLC|nr:protein dj-1beta [Neodiprion lecontei]XP_046424968.1 protein dj-1beta-like [Neodiprion fabricii]XP_046618773.1 protein dj-1beta-like [Neodiprion virginianus]
MPKTAILLLAEGAEEMEAVITIDVLRRAGIAVTVASLDGSNVVTCSRGVKICPDEQLTDEHKDKAYDVVIMPGGLAGSQALAKSDKVGAILQKQASENRLVAAICAAPTALKAHGLAKGKKITAYPSMKDQLQDDYTYIDEKVVIDGNFITSQGPSTAYLFGLAIVEALIGKPEATTVARGMLCDEYK